MRCDMPEEYVRMPRQDYIDICNAVRSQTGSSAQLRSGDIAAAICTIRLTPKPETVFDLAQMTFDGLSWDAAVTII